MTISDPIRANNDRYPGNMAKLHQYLHSWISLAGRWQESAA